MDVQSLGRTVPRMMHRSSPNGFNLICKTSHHEMLQQKEESPYTMPNYTVPSFRYKGALFKETFAMP